jgi:hypothetical protein
MAYFANGTEGEVYEHKYCNKCRIFKNGTCPVLDLHMIYNGNDTFEEVLDILIPRVDGENQKCSYYEED